MKYAVLMSIAILLLGLFGVVFGLYLIATANR